MDGSPVGVGGVLEQKQKDGTFKLIAYASRILSDVERRYSQAERETLAVVYIILRFHVYLWGINFTVLSDCRSLEKIFTRRHESTPRILNLFLKVQPFSFQVQFLPGYLNRADILSRKPIRETDDSICSQTENYVHLVTNCSVPIAVTLDELQECSQSDPCSLETSTHLSREK